MVAVDSLKTTFTGEIILPGDAEYEKASTAFIAKGTPAVVVRPKTSQDVSEAINFAKKNNLILSVKSGGHSGTGQSTNNGGMVIDLMYLNRVEIVDAAQNIVRIGTGALWGDVMMKLKEHGLAISSGDTKTVGVGGLVTGGGIGWMARKFGLTIDSVVAAEVVTATGQILQVNEAENSDLFWGIRGGGGNFGIVTHVDIIAQKIEQVYAGHISYGVENMKEVLVGWREYMRTSPEELTTMCVIMPQFGEMPPAVLLMCCFAGDDETQAMDAINPLTKFPGLVKNDVQKKEYAAVLEDAHPPQGVKIVVNNGFVKEFTDEVIGYVIDAAKNNNAIFQIRSLGGAIDKVSADATAFAHRGNEVLIISPAFVPPTATEEQVNKAQEYWQNIGKNCTGAYVNFVSEVNEKQVALAYPVGVFEKMSKLKKKYDPMNLFSQNLNVKSSI